MEGFCIISSFHMTMLEKDSERLFSGLDVTLKCCDGEVKVKRNILEYCSSLVRQMFQSCPLSQPPFLFLPEFEYRDMAAMARFVNTGATNIQCGRLENFTKIATYLKIRGLESPYEDSIPGKVFIDERFFKDEVKPLVVDLHSRTTVAAKQEVPLQLRKSDEQATTATITTSESTPKNDSSSVPTPSASSCSIQQEQQYLEDRDPYKMSPMNTQHIAAQDPNHPSRDDCRKYTPKIVVKRLRKTQTATNKNLVCETCSKVYQRKKWLKTHELVCPDRPIEREVQPARHGPVGYLRDPV